MHISLLQCQSGQDVGANLQFIQSQLKLLEREHADPATLSPQLVVLPECSLLFGGHESAQKRYAQASEIKTTAAEITALKTAGAEITAPRTTASKTTGAKASHPTHALKPHHSPLQQALSALAAQHRVYLVAGTIPILAADGRLHSRCYLFDDKGATLGHYDKL
ncbi:MAG: nitrilase-related carbon-nitrogen hydrolase, partial [Shewanella sp.]